MAQFKEIEIKWGATCVKRPYFNQKLRAFLKLHKLRYKFFPVAGFDYYHSSEQGHVTRHRHGAGTNELTIKSRVSKKSTTIRREINLKLDKCVSPLEVQEAMGELDFNTTFSIYKDCDIYFVKDGKYIVDVVWYKTSSPQVKGDSKYFLEVEIHGASEKVSIRMLKRWKKALYTLYGLTDKDIVHESLYEIYSGKKYRMSKKK